MSRELTPPPALAGIDLAAHRERARNGLVLHIGLQNMASPPTEWEASADALLAMLERYGIVPVWVFDPKFERPWLTASQIGALASGRVVNIPAGRALSLPAGYFFPDDVGGCE